jgi:hypothetical protein
MGRLRILIAALVLSTQAQALELAKVSVATTVTLSNGENLVLNGAGIRKKFFFKIYVGALYLTGEASTPAEVYAMPGGKRIWMHFIYDEVSKEKLINGWNEGFEANLDRKTLAALQDRINAFNKLFNMVQEGDEIRLDYIPNTGTEVWIENTLQGTITGADFNQALLRIWLGDEPADSGLKKAMLGQ